MNTAINAINVNDIMTDVSATDIYIENMLKKYAERMPEGKFFNLHDNSIDNCDGIVLLADGNVCPTFNGRSRYWSLNPLSIGEDMVRLRTASCAGVMMSSDTLDHSILNYNNQIVEQLRKYSIDQTSKLIVAYYEFK